MTDCIEDNIDSLLKSLDSEECEENKLDACENLNNLKEELSESSVTVNKLESSDGDYKSSKLSAKYSEYGYDIHRILKTAKSDNSDYYPKHSSSSSWKNVPKTDNNFSTVPLSQADKRDIYCDPIFQLRIINPVVSSQFIKAKMIGRQPIPVSRIKYHLTQGEKNVDWVFAGVVVSKSATKTSQKGSQYCIWKISDLKGEMKQISLYLFGNAYKDLWKTQVSTVIGVLNATTFSNWENTSEEVTVTVRNTDQIMLWGLSKDFAICKAKKKNGDNCTMFVNKSDCEFCVYHVKSEYNKFSTNRSDLYSTSSMKGRLSLQNKVLGKSEIFYQGKSYTNTKPSSQSKKLKEKDNKILKWLTPAGINNNTSVKGGNKSLIEADNDRLKLLSVENNSSYEKSSSINKNNVTVTSNTANACQRWEKIQEAQQKPKSDVAALTLTEKKLHCKFSEVFNEDNKRLKENKRGTKSQSDSPLPVLRKSNSKFSEIFNGTDNDKPLNKTKPLHKSSSPASPVTSTYTTSNNVKKQLVEIDLFVEEPNMNVFTDKIESRTSNNSTPGIAEIKMFSKLPPLTKSFRQNRLLLAKQQAIHLIRKSGGIKKENPNSIKSNNKSTKRSHDNEAECNDGGDKGTELAPTKSVLSERFIELMNATSNHMDLVTIAENMEQEKYFTNMEKKEQLEEKMLTTFKVLCKAVRCLKCKYTWFSASDHCKSEQHPIKVIDAVKRFFKCSQCNNRTVSLEILPLVSCKQCGNFKWTRAPMLKEKLAKIDGLCIRGDEEKFLGTLSSNSSLSLMVPE